MKINKIYQCTRQGLDIILGLVPQAAEALDKPLKMKFKYRPEERTASAMLLPPNEKCSYWRMKDFGLNEPAFSPIDLYMREKGMIQEQFTEALYELAAQYGVEDEKITQQNLPQWVERERLPEEVIGLPILKFRDHFTQHELSVWGDAITEEILTRLAWKPVEYIGFVNSVRVKECHSTDTYPIFAQKCPYIDRDGNEQSFWKVYKPREYDGGQRFMSIGSVQRNYIFGLDALVRAWRKNGEHRLDEVFLVSGGSDAANCLAMGGQPVWLNSETAEFTQEQHDLLLRYAKRIIQIGDTDATGKRVSIQRAKQYLDIYTVTLPEEKMNRFKDARGKRRKDLKDYVQLFPGRKNFWNLVQQARKAQFWFTTEEKKGDETITVYHISAASLCYFLELHGYFTIHDENHERPHYIHMDGMVVESIFVKSVRNFINNWRNEHGLPEGLQNCIIHSRDIPSRETSNLRELILSFKDSSPKSQIFYFRNTWVEVTADGIHKHQLTESTTFNSYVWKHDIIQHDYADMKPMFEVEKLDDGTYGARLTDENKSDVLTFLRNASRLYWREEDEQGLVLSPEQIHEERQCLAAKLACIGYYLHHYREGSRSWAAILQDAQLAEDERECNGRSGKSIFIKFLRALVETKDLEGRDTEIVKNRFLLDGVTESTRLVAVDECARTFPYQFFFGKITGSLLVEEKNNHPFEIDFKDAPKWLFATNYVIPKTDSSTEARLWPQVFSTYYHKMTKENGYKETREVSDTFGYQLLEADYPEEKWQADIAFAMQCLQFYLSLPESERKIMPPMATIERRTQRALMGKSFEDWASDYYQPGSEHLDVSENYDEVKKNYCQEVGIKDIAANTFTKLLKTFCNGAEHIHCYNPAEFTESKRDGQRIRDRHVSKIHVRSYQWVAVNTLPF